MGFDVACIGGAALDRKYRAAAPLALATSNPAAAETHFGGVARNVSENLALLGARAALHSLAGGDSAGRALLEHLRARGVDVAGVRIIEGARTAEYAAVLEPGGALHVGLADMAIFGHFDFRDVEAVAKRPTQWIFADCNLPAPALARLIGLGRRGGARLAVDAVSAAKAQRLPQDCAGVDLLFLNRQEAAAILGRETAPETAAQAMLSRGARAVALTLGEQGLLIADASGVTAVPALAAKMLDATGAGDALIAAMLWRLSRGDSFAAAAQLGVAAAAATVASPRSVRPDLAQAMAGGGDAAIA